jgi:hypothetical protein
LRPKPESGGLVFLIDKENPRSPNRDNRYWNNLQKHFAVKTIIRGQNFAFMYQLAWQPPGFEVEVAMKIMGLQSDMLDKAGNTARLALQRKNRRTFDL